MRNKFYHKDIYRIRKENRRARNLSKIVCTNRRGQSVGEENKYIYIELGQKTDADADMLNKYCLQTP
jgi:hypothetical protein